MDILTIVLSIGVLATFGALISGIISMSHGGQFDAAHSHQLMFARVGLQGVTIICLLVALYMAL